MADKPELRVLIIDDEPDFLTTYKPIFEMNSVPVDTAPTGKEGLAKIPVFRPSVIVCDVMMPDISGKDVLIAIKKDPNWLRIPVIMLSALSGEMQRDEFIALGASEYLEKINTDPAKLLEMIKVLTGLTPPEKKLA